MQDKGQRNSKKNKVILLSLISFALFLTVFGNRTFLMVQDRYLDVVLEKEKSQTIDFLLDHSNLNPESPGYGLVADRMSQPTMASIAAVGMALAVYPIAVENKKLSYEEAEKIVNGTLDTLLNHLETEEGFFYHFIYMDSAKRYAGSEISIIDTGIAVMGAFIAAAYFEGEIAQKAQQIYERVNWPWYFNESNQKFYMEYLPENAVHSGEWGVYAEQMMLYILSSVSPTYPVSKSAYYRFDRQKEKHFDFVEFVRSPINAHFVYQYSNAFIDFRDLFDLYGDNWHQNSIAASTYAKQFAIETSDYFQTLNENQWGLTAGDGLSGYSGLYGSDIRQANDGSLSLTGLLASIAFVPEDVKEAVLALKKDRRLWNRDYGLIEGFNDEYGERIYFEDLISINKLMNLMMIENAQTGFIWDLSKKVPPIQEGLKKLGFSESKALSYWSCYQKEQIELVETDHIEKETGYLKFGKGGTTLFELSPDTSRAHLFKLLGSGYFKLEFLDDQGMLLYEEVIEANQKSLELDKSVLENMKFLKIKSDEGRLEYFGFGSDASVDKFFMQVNQRPYLQAKTRLYVDGLDLTKKARYGMELEGKAIQWQKNPEFKIPRDAKAKKVRYLIELDGELYKGPSYQVLKAKPQLSASKEKILLQHANLPHFNRSSSWTDGGDKVYEIKEVENAFVRLEADKNGLPWSFAKKDLRTHPEQEVLSFCYQSEGDWLLKLETQAGDSVEWLLKEDSKQTCQEFSVPKEMLGQKETKLLLFALPGEENGAASIEIKIKEEVDD